MVTLLLYMDASLTRLTYQLTQLSHYRDSTTRTVGIQISQGIRHTAAVYNCTVTSEARTSSTAFKARATQRRDSTTGLHGGGMHGSQFQVLITLLRLTAPSLGWSRWIRLLAPADRRCGPVCGTVSVVSLAGFRSPVGGPNNWPNLEQVGARH